MEHISGKNVGAVVLYALSTCGWCAKTRKLLNELGIDYSFEYVDLLDDDKQEIIMQSVEKWNPSRSFPVIVINNQKSIIGFNEARIREELKS
jgi:glutaredoxin-like protein NrdH